MGSEEAAVLSGRCVTLMLWQEKDNKPSKDGGLPGSRA